MPAPYLNGRHLKRYYAMTSSCDTESSIRYVNLIVYFGNSRDTMSMNQSALYSESYICRDKGSMQWIPKHIPLVRQLDRISAISLKYDFIVESVTITPE